MSRRRVRPEELELWREVARSTEKLGRRDHFAPIGPTPVTRDPDPVLTPKAVEALAPFTLGQKSKSQTKDATLPRTTAQRLNGDAVQMDKKSHTRLKRGKLMPEARIDLHGMTLDQAHPTLT
ncbi:MAG: Smr/MutS family protein, partial [Rhodobacterales bacterium]